MSITIILRLLTVFLPLHSLHLSLSSMVSPRPRQFRQRSSYCSTIPGATFCTLVITPVPLQGAHLATAPFFPPMPSQLSQMIFFLKANFRCVPLYNSSKVTDSECIKLGPRLSRFLFEIKMLSSI
uniref:Putative secreted protein n=1 Tax=Anopheles darlingi TaxID=43151 RepID=A0A2M4D703_ANODA